MFINENLNPKKKKTGDCVIRAIAKAEGKAWLEVFDILSEIARKNYTNPNHKDAYYQYLKKYDKIDVMHMIGDKKKRYTVEEIAKWNGIYLIKTAGHLTVTIDGNYYDIWDCGDKCAYVIWKVK